MDRGLNELLKWGIENSSTTANDPSAAPPTNRGLDPAVLASLMGGPSDADLMKAAMAVIADPDPSVTLDNRLIAFDNLEQLIESLDNANNLGPLSLWSPLLDQLDSKEAEMRRMAAWCIGTAVQNNEPSQERLLAMGGLPRLLGAATREGEDDGVRRKAVYALSSAVRNYQPAMDVASGELAKLGLCQDKIDASNMDAVDEMIEALKARGARKEEAT